jgi:hypothetical protein
MRIILLEFNELCPLLLEQWINEGKLPNFAKFYQNSNVFTALADEDRQEFLEPWIQWYSMHTGLPFTKHGVFHLSDGPKAGYRDIWQAVLSNNRTVFNCGSMNASGFSAPGSMFLPDPWCTTEPPYPQELSAYHQFISSQVQTNTSKGGSRLGDALRFMAYVSTHGLSMETVGAVASQLVAERTSSDDVSWRRAALLDKFQVDLFEHHWRRNKPDFSTFFLNSTAHFQHAYWHIAFPDDFSKEEQRGSPTSSLAGAVFYGYQQMDALLERFFEMEREGALLVFASALSQRANPEELKRYYRPIDVAAMLAELGVKPAKTLPVMAEQFSLEFATQQEADDARSRLKALVLADGRQVFAFNEAPERHVFFGVGIKESLDQELKVEGLSGKPSFKEVFREIPHTKSGLHHRESALWVKTGKHVVHSDPVSILDVMPTILDYLAIDPNAAGAGHGSSLLPVINGVAAHQYAS